MSIRERPSPNRDARPEGAVPALVVLHYTGMHTAAAALDRLCDPAARVSAHYLIDEDGSVLRLVPEAAQAWHAGRSFWAGRCGLNATSLGIELVNPGHEWGYRPFPEAQLAALEELLRDLLGRWRIGPEGVLGHSDIAPDRKQDPGELFSWRRLAGQGLALWPEGSRVEVPDAHRAATRLRRIGYGLGEAGVPLPTALRAFQRRFRADLVDGILDGATMGRLGAVEALCRCSQVAS